jgi:SAM-dependent methyltransferase
MTADRIADSLLAVAAGDNDRALANARAATRGAASGTPQSRLADALLRHLEGGEGGRGVYTDPAAFERFIDGGGNVALYQRAHAALAERHARLAPDTVVDLGCGDGRLTGAAIRPGLERLDLVEPSAELLAAARERLRGQPIVAHQSTAQQLVDTLPDGARWDVAQSTFALHAVPPADRQRVLAALAERARHLLLVEFDVPPFADRSPDHARYAAGRYAAGVAEYDGDLVVDGFLVPVLVGQFAPDRPRHTWEQPIDAWIADLTAAGFTDVRHREISPYWWAPAHLVEATPPPTPDTPPPR